jgi:hypothetical protein
MTKFAAPEEMQHAHSILLKGNPYFEQDKIDIIECNETCDILACPGSGKTTTLLAKLIILANRMPLPNNQGICVLTHTNVAIDEIKSKLGNKADILFKYPNHFGTIQSFVDKFLAIPYFAKIYKRKPVQISDDLFVKSLYKSFTYKLNSIKKINESLYNRMYSYLYGNQDWFQNVRIVKINSRYELFNIEHQHIIHFNKPKKKSKTYLDWSDEEKDEMKNMTIEIIKDVYKNHSLFCYHDAYLFSSIYASEVPQIKDAISSRFKYLFIDEMQDTDKHQSDIIEAVFDKHQTVIQRFGDHRQAIYNRVIAEEQWMPQNPLSIKNSKRFGEKIAEVLRYVCCENNNTLKTDSDVYSLPPVMIVFKRPEDVLPKFCELLSSKRIGNKTVWEIYQDYKNADETSYKIKAIGWVKTDTPKKLTIKSYFPDFNKHTKDKVDYDSLKSFLKKQTGARVIDYSNKIIEALLYILSMDNKKYTYGKINRNYTKTTFLKELETKSLEKLMEYKINIVKWAKSIHDNEIYCNVTVEEVRTYIKSVFCPLFDIDITKQSISNFIDNNTDTIVNSESTKCDNVYKQMEIEIEVATIHSVKGETHVATLYLETSYQGKCEGECIAKQLAKNYYVPPSKKTDTHRKETLKMAHVGMSRPKYFLCMAIHNSRFNNSFDINNGGLWEIVNA